MSSSGESQRRENSIFPSASVGTPLQVAGRYRQVRTVRSTLRSPDGSSTLQNQRTVHAAVGADNKADFDFESCFDRNRQRIGRSQSFRGGWVSSQRGRALTWGMSVNSAARVGVLKIWCSRSAKSDWLRRRRGTCTEAVLDAGIARIRSQGQMRCIGETFQVKRKLLLVPFYWHVWCQAEKGLSILLSIH